MRCQASCRVEFGTCIFFSGGCNRGVSGPSYCDWILGGTFESVQGHQALSRVDGEIGDFGILA